MWRVYTGVVHPYMMQQVAKVPLGSTPMEIDAFWQRPRSPQPEIPPVGSGNPLLTGSDVGTTERRESYPRRSENYPRVRGVGRPADVRRNPESDSVILQDHPETGVKTNIFVHHMSRTLLSNHHVSKNKRTRLSICPGDSAALLPSLPSWTLKGSGEDFHAIFLVFAGPRLLFSKCCTVVPVTRLRYYPSKHTSMRKRTDGMEPRFFHSSFHSLIFPFETKPSPGGDPRRSPAPHQLK